MAKIAKDLQQISKNVNSRMKEKNSSFIVAYVLCNKADTLIAIGSTLLGLIVLKFLFEVNDYWLGIPIAYLACTLLCIGVILFMKMHKVKKIINNRRKGKA